MSLRTGSRMSLRRKISLSKHTTMQTGGPAEYFAEPSSEHELLQALEFARHKSLPVVVLGKGSNMIFPDDGYPGLVISLLQYEKTRLEFDLSSCSVRASAGVHLYRLVLACRDRGLGGAEFLASIPGTLGGALMMNAGFSRFPGQKNEIGDLVYEVHALTYEGVKKTFAKNEICFGYRTSSFKDVILLEGVLRLSSRRFEDIDQEIKACFDYRNQKQDLTRPSSGSIFKNPKPPLPAAAKLIDTLGLKGTRLGGVMVSPRHSNYFINLGDGTSRDVAELIRVIQEKVFHAAKIQLEPEVKIITAP